MPFTFSQWAAALAMTESQNHDTAIGDAGRALGAWQIHPDFYDTYYPDIHIGMSWRDAFYAALKVFWDKEWGQADIDVANAAILAQKFHLGVSAYNHGNYDNVYAQRFHDYLVKP